ncbi:hypothetical protein ncot_04960 [Nocardioides sp. JQ2195]|uniref:hypothetical protein n=1 Tax=Nocardioides sp. JQ2195 TaxID=2592334 RepID=UPI00143E13BE|nr:hypothetical protein [Nocardioides sp. JQ2195]QIX26025.1 hypothetical protein ncot_04960 [Nocardioides sp. JQ2195]
MSRRLSRGRTDLRGAPGRPSRTPLVALVAAVVAVALVCVAVVVALVLTLGGDDSSPVADDPSSSVEPSDGPSSPRTPDASTVAGVGYSYLLPGGWSDVSDDVEGVGSGDAIDSVSAWGSQFQGARANFIVNVTPAGPSETPEDLADGWKEAMRKELDAQPHDIAGLVIDGQESVGVRFARTNEHGVEIVQVAHLVVNDGKAYTLGMSTTPERESDTDEALAQIVDSWVWS